MVFAATVTGVAKATCCHPDAVSPEQLRPYTILTAQVLVKLIFTLLTMALLVLAGKRYYPVLLDVPIASSALALAISTLAILSMGFLIASLVPTARFARRRQTKWNS